LGVGIIFGLIVFSNDLGAIRTGGLPDGALIIKNIIKLNPMTAATTAAKINVDFVLVF
jgi:hypothetical protein